MTVGVDLSNVVRAIPAQALGYCCSTYEATPLDDPAQARAEQALAPGLVRIPVGVRGGRVTSSAAGGPTDLDVPALVRLYRSWGARVLVVLGGRTTDVDLQPGDATTVMRALGFDGVEYSTPNEPSLRGLSVDAAGALARQVLAEGRALRPDLRLWGPAWAGSDRNALRAFASALGAGLAGLDWHRYGLSGADAPTDELMASTASFGEDVRQARADLDGLGLRDAGLLLSEVNLASTADNGSPGGEQRFYAAESTVWLTSVLGHVLTAGAGVLPYASRNGALGLTASADNPRGVPAASPMPAYWAVAAWTGARALYLASSSRPDVDAFAYRSQGADGTRGSLVVLVVNRSESTPASVELTIQGSRATAWTATSTARERPFAAPADAGRGELDPSAGPAVIRLDARPMSVTRLVLPQAIA